MCSCETSPCFTLTDILSISAIIPHGPAASLLFNTTFCHMLHSLINSFLKFSSLRSAFAIFTHIFLYLPPPQLPFLGTFYFFLPNCHHTCTLHVCTGTIFSFAYKIFCLSPIFFLISSVLCFISSFYIHAGMG